MTTALGYVEVSGEPHNSNFMLVVGKSLTRLGSKENGRGPRNCERRQVRSFFFFFFNSFIVIYFPWHKMHPFKM